MASFRNPVADPLGTRRGPPLVRGPQFENRCANTWVPTNSYRSILRCTWIAVAEIGRFRR